MNIISGKRQGFTIRRLEKATGCTGRPKLSGKTIITTGTGVSHEDLKASAGLTAQQIAAPNIMEYHTAEEAADLKKQVISSPGPRDVLPGPH